MNKQKLVEKEVAGNWETVNVTKNTTLKAGIYNIYNYKEPLKSEAYSGVVIHTDKDNAYQEVKKNTYIQHNYKNLNCDVKTGDNVKIEYTSNKANVTNISNSRRGVKI